MLASLIKLRDSVRIGTSEYTSVSNNRCELRVQFGEVRGVTVAIPGEAEIFIPLENVTFCRLIMPSTVETVPARPPTKRGK